MPTQRTPDGTTPRTRELGATLRRYRLAANVPSHEVAARLGVSAAQITHVEKGERNLDDFNLATFLGMCEVPRTELAAIFALSHEPDGYRVQRHGGELRDSLRTVIYLETNAIELVNFQPLVIPGLAQTEDYARALFHLGQSLRTPPVIEAHVDARMRRKKILDRANPPRLHFYVHENALRGVIGSPKIMYEQMISLLLLTATPNYRINILRTKDFPQGLYGGPFVLMRYAKHQPVVAIETRTATLLLEDPHDTADYEYMAGELAKMSLSANDSREFIDELSSEYEHME